MRAALQEREHQLKEWNSNLVAAQQSVEELVFLLLSTQNHYFPPQNAQIDALQEQKKAQDSEIAKLKDENGDLKMRFDLVQQQNAEVSETQKTVEESLQRMRDELQSQVHCFTKTLCYFLMARLWYHCGIPQAT